MESQTVMVARRDQPTKEKRSYPISQLIEQSTQLLTEIQNNYFKEAKAYRDAHIYRDLETFEQLRAFFTPKSEEKPEIHGGFVLAKWCGDPATEKLLHDMKVTIRCIPLEQRETTGKCILTGKPATLDAIFAKSY